jgi:hypothetical protein
MAVTNQSSTLSMMHLPVWYVFRQREYLSVCGKALKGLRHNIMHSTCQDGHAAFQSLVEQDVYVW